MITELSSNTRQVERIEKEGDGSQVYGFKGCKNMSQVFAVALGKFSKSHNEEARQLTLMFQQQYKRFHREKIANAKLLRWKGKSSFEIIKQLDKIIIIKYQKPDKDSTPEEIKTEVTKEELNAMVNSILKLKNEQPIKTKSLSITYSYLLGLNHSGWKRGINPIFSDRTFHNKYTLILGALDYLGLIKYSAGKTTILNNNISIQLILN